MKPLFANVTELKERADAYFEHNQLVAPKAFRVWLGISKYNLSSWKKSNPEYFNLIKTYEQIILARVEEFAIYGNAHPIIREYNIIETHNDKGELIETKTAKWNNVGSMFILRAYEKEQYVPEIAAQMTKENTQEAKLIEIITPKKSAKKGAQSVRPTKLIERPKT